MKRLILSLAIIVSAISMNAQTRTLNLELLGTAGMAGINYDARFAGNHGFGYSVCLGYGISFSDWKCLLDPSNYGINHQIGIPVEINYLFGKGNSHLVLGAGVYTAAVINDAAGSLQFGYMTFADFAYRYQKPEGFSFAVGVKPNIIFEEYYPYITIGKSF